eukprot:13906510-Alexandrium_andersonii.AAC.1
MSWAQPTTPPGDEGSEVGEAHRYAARRHPLHTEDAPNTQEGARRNGIAAAWLGGARRRQAWPSTAKGASRLKLQWIQTGAWLNEEATLSLGPDYVCNSA